MDVSLWVWGGVLASILAALAVDLFVFHRDAHEVSIREAAIDSVPAIFAVTDDTFIIFTSNAFAILGLPALYFLFAGPMAKLFYLKLGLAGVLGFVGVKMLLAEVYKIPIVVSLAMIVTILVAAPFHRFDDKRARTLTLPTPNRIGSAPQPSKRPPS